MFKENPNVMLRPTRNAYAEVWEMKANEFVQKLEDLFSRWWDGRHNRTLVKCIDDDVSRRLRLEAEHFFEAFYHSAITRFLLSTIVCRIESGEYVTTGIGPSRKLDKERRKQIAESLFTDVPEVKIEIGHWGPSSVAQRHNILYNRGT
jgi:hypothetical protein